MSEDNQEEFYNPTALDVACDDLLKIVEGELQIAKVYRPALMSDAKLKGLRTWIKEQLKGR